MKQYYYALVLSCTVSLGFGQSIKDVLLHVTKDSLNPIYETTQEDQNQSIDQQKERPPRFINFNEVSIFSGEEDYQNLLHPFGALNQATIFTVYQLDDVTVERELWRIQGESSTISLTTKTAANSKFQSDYVGGETTQPTLNTYIQSYRPKNSSSGKQEGISIGRYTKANAGFKGAVAEILMFNRVLRGKKRQAIASALALKYGISLTNGKDYRASDKTSIYTIKDHEGFTSRIAGIGRDDTNGLYQKQSRSSVLDAALTIGFDEIVKTNAENSAILKDNSFIVWADNNLPLQILTEQSKERNGLISLQRHWHLQVSGKHIPEENTQVQLDLNKTSLSKEEKADNYLLIIDRSGTGSFKEKDIDYINALSINEGKVLFNNIHWDTDRSGSDQFTFTILEDLVLELSEVAPIDCSGNDVGALEYKAKGGIAPYTYSLENDIGYLKQWSSAEDANQDYKIQGLASGNYILTVTDALQAKQIIEYSLKAPGKIEVDLGPDRRFDFDQESIVLDASPTDGIEANYNWTSNNGFESTNDNVTLTEAGTYKVTVTAKGGCSSTDEITIDKSLLQSYFVFPNQSQDGNYQVRIQLLEKQDVTVKIFDVAGRLIESIQGNDKDSYTLPGKRIEAAGLYHVVLQSNTQKASRKLIVE